MTLGTLILYGVITAVVAVVVVAFLGSFLILAGISAWEWVTGRRATYRHRRRITSHPVNRDRR